MIGNLATQRTTFTSGPGNVAYGYDKIGQLKVATSTAGGENRGYDYDSAWNLNYRTNNGVLGTFLVDTKNELTNAPSPMGTMTYDSDGNLVGANGQYTYAYDGENRLTMWIYAQFGLSNLTNGDLVTTFAYDGLGRLRIRDEYILNCPSPQRPAPPGGNAGAFPAPPPGCNWVLTSETRYIYDGYRVIQERDSNNVPVVSYTRGTDLSGTLEGAGGIGGLLARSSGYSGGNWTTHVYYHTDGGGNVTYLVDGSQTLAATYRYDPYGNTVSSSGPLAVSNLYRFSSKEIHSSSGMYYFLYRFYDPNLQRWMSRDPAGEGADVCLYRFVFNDPMGYVDPDGFAATPQRPNLTPLSSGGSRRDPNRSQLEHEMSPSGPVSPSVSRNLDRGCIGLTSAYQGAGQTFPENAPGTKCFLSQAEASARTCASGQQNFVFAKQGKWSHGAPSPNPVTGEIPRGAISSAHGDYNYVVSFPGTDSYAWMNQAKRYGPQIGSIAPSYPHDPHYPHTIWCSTCQQSP